jgi:hypothetical protein
MRNNLRSIFLALFFISFIIAIGGGLFWGNMNFVRSVRSGTDFLALWKPTQNFAMQGVSPYDVGNTLEVQRLIYGRTARAGERSFQFSLPLYTALLFFPIGSIRDFTIARTLWMILLQAAAMGLVFTSMHMSRWRPSWLSLPLLLLFALFWLPGALSIVDGNFIVLQSLFVFGAVRAIETDADELAGALAAFGLLYISVTGLSLLLLAVWMIASGRYRILAGFLMTLTVLVAISFLVFPGWFSQFFFSGIIEWRTQALPSTFRSLENWFPGIGIRLAQGLRAVAIAVLFFEWQAVRGKGPHWLFWTMSLTAVLTPWFGMKYTPAWAAFTLPVVILVLSVVGQRWGLLGRLAALLVGLGLLAGLWAAYLSGLDSVFLFAYPLVMAVLLYWVRWWATRPPRLWMDMVSQGR